MKTVLSILALAALALFATDAQAGHRQRVVVQRVVVRPHVQRVVVQRVHAQPVVVQQVQAYHAPVQAFVAPSYGVQAFSAGHCQQQFVAPVQRFNAGHSCGALLQLRAY